MHNGTDYLRQLLEPERYLATFNNFEKWGRVNSTQQIATSRLDDVSEICHMDMLKIDIQGGELSVFESGRKRLHETVAIQTEASFVPLY